MQVRRVAESSVLHPLCLRLVIAASSCGGSPSSAPSPTPTPTPTTPDAKADALVAQMTQAEKLQMVQGGVPRIRHTGTRCPAARAAGCRESRA